MLKNRKENLNMSKKCLKVLSTHVFSVTSFEKALLEIHHYLHLNISSTQWNCLFSFGIGRGWILSRINKVYEIFSHSNKRVSPQLIGVLKLLSSLSSHYHKIYVFVTRSSRREPACSISGQRYSRVATSPTTWFASNLILPDQAFRGKAISKTSS